MSESLLAVENNPATVLRARRLQKRYGANLVLQHIDLDIAEGEVLCLIGPSGSGKSTLLRLLATLESPDSGVIFFQNTPLGLVEKNGRVYAAPEKIIRQQRDRIGFVFQQFNLFPHLTVLQNVMLAPQLQGQRREAEEKARALLARVGLAHKADEWPGSLSGGQQQRVAIARALARDPALILFDEPTSALDPELVNEVLAVMTDLASTGITMVVATHEMQFARRVASHVAFLDQGHIVEYGLPQQVLDAPQQARTRAFLQQISSLRNEVADV
ncbi:amino acid ABC transporter ATP-binding protein [Pantoea sp. A4]|uniref:amino acid ABC transporter ATP-binding protein n=1 Tax=Pantoea sp. A4 TaxID=1225184 RepID=UPI0003734169|nr:amino acid ABC transporter ATP-binding protein [Pantoea sp. A4]